MWKRKALKKTARSSIRQHYWKMTFACFVIAFLTTAYPVSTTFLNLQIAPGSRISDAVFAPDLPNSEIIRRTVSFLSDGCSLYHLFGTGAAKIAHLLIDLYTTSISVFFTALRAANAFLINTPDRTALFIAAGAFLTLLYYIFVNNLLQIGEKRFFLEIRNYPQTPLSKLFFLFKLRYILHPAWVMFCRCVFQGLWNLTIIGGIIKHYEYSMIPFILAENPKIRTKDAFFLSRQLTYRNKGRLFLLDLSFFGWKILSVLTLGILDFIIVNPYVMECYAALYLTLRRNYVLSRSHRYECLNDSYLEHVPSEDELLISKALYDDSQGPYTKTTYFAPEQYPVFLFSVQPPIRSVKSPARVGRKYDLQSCILLFHLFSISGWILEKLVYLARDGAVADNNGLLGPWAPVYGIFGILCLAISKRCFKRPEVVFCINLVIYSFVEYMLNLISDLILGHPLRDYSEFFLNLHGRVYLGGSISFALLGCAFLYYLAPRWSDLFAKWGRCKRTLVSIILNLLFIADIALTVLIAF